jgi:hypothetical protein
MSTLICFALKEEVAPFRKIAAGNAAAVQAAHFHLAARCCHVYFPFMKMIAAPVKSPNKRRASKWIPGAGNEAAISKTQADRFTDGLLKIAARIKDLPADFARNHDHYLHGLPRK